MAEHRIISLCPSLTQTTCELGLKASVVGCTSFCVRPTDIHRLATPVGGTKDPDLALIASLNPTAILVNEEENKPEHVAELERHFPVLRTFPRAPSDVAPMLRAMGAFLNSEEAFEKAAREVEGALATIRTSPKSPFHFLYFIWQRPYMIAGADTYISRLLEEVGGVNAWQGDERYPSLELTDVADRKIDVILLSTEPYPFRRRDVSAFRASLPGVSDVLKIDGQLMSWHGTLTAEALRGLMAWRQNKDSAMIARFEP